MFIRNPTSEYASRASNERLIFYMDAHRLVYPDDDTWEVTDYGPSFVIGALAHEFQHMIHYYQKPVTHGIWSETWLNEMASEAATDLIADKISVHGPRGVLDDPTAGEPENRRGRLPDYNAANYIQLTAWSIEDWFSHYGIVYAFGAYLARTYGGAALFGDIVQSEHTGVDAIEAALSRHGHTVSFGDVLMNWAAANLLSDNTDAPSPYQYNTGTWATSYAGGQAYRLGSINLYNYQRYDDSERGWRGGPVLFGFHQFSGDGLVSRPHSNSYTTIGQSTGTVRLRIGAESGNRITVVVKE